jgi:nitrite reductase/ring-hydroxylating ferredoxin subunit/uncharacterized membrane protein
VALASVLDRLLARVERAESLDGPADKLAAAIQLPLKSKAIRDTLSGTQIGHPVHPLLVAVPIGSFVAASCLDLTGKDRDAARRLVGIGLLSAIPTAATGASDWSYTSGAERRIGLVHAASNWIALAGYASSWQARRSNRHGLGTVLALAGATALSVGGWLGGHLVYARGVGVDTTAFEVAEDDWLDTVAEAELADGQPVLAHAGDVAVVLLRQGEQIFALDDRCTHRGGPLHEGTVADGCISCPWHGSRFRVDTGEVAAGPATRPQRSWQVRTRYGAVQVRIPAEAGSLRTNPVS